jgi:hypothetical protein
MAKEKEPATKVLSVIVLKSKTASSILVWRIIPV